MMNKLEVRASILFASALVVATACARNPAAQTASSRRNAVESAGVMDRCQANEALVVVNKTPYAARVIATDGTQNGSQLLEVVPAGVVDTIPRVAASHQKVHFDLEQPLMASGVPAPVSGFSARCVPAV